MKDGERLIPVSETEFAKDNVFGYHTSVLHDYILEKAANPDDYVIVDAQNYEELCAVAARLISYVRSHDSSIIIRSSSSLPKAIAGCPDIPLLDGGILKNKGVGCFIIGSHVKKTTRQLEALLGEDGTYGVELDVRRILEDAEPLMQDTLSVMQQVAWQGLTPVVYTSRQEVRLDDANRRQHLGQRISDFLVDVVRQMPFTPAYLVAKGGITSHDIMTKGLGIKSARVMGQIVNSVPCVMTKEFPYVIFPGNVGDEGSLREAYLKLSASRD